MATDIKAHYENRVGIDSLAGRSAWIISDEKAGHEAQCLGVAESLGLDVAFKHVAPRGIWKAFAPYAPVAPSEKFGTPESQFSAPWPDIAFAAGRLTIPYIRALKRVSKAETFTVILLDPKTGPGAADLFWVPEHDRLRGDNVITTLTPPHRFSPTILVNLRNTPAPFPCSDERPNAVVLLGGPNADYVYSYAAIERLVAALRSLQQLGAFLLVTVSRRTPDDLLAAVRELVGDGEGYLWDGEGDNPLAHFYARGDLFVTPADSINMTAEPCVTGRPVYVFHPDGGSRKFDHFHDALEDYGATRPLPETFESIEMWSYKPLFACDAIADEITRRWSQRCK